MVQLRPRAQPVKAKEPRPMKLHIRSRRVVTSDDDDDDADLDLSDVERSISHHRRSSRRQNATTRSTRSSRSSRSSRSRNVSLLEKEIQDLQDNEEEEGNYDYNDETGFVEEESKGPNDDFSDDEEEDVPIDALPDNDGEETGIIVDDAETSEINQLVAFLVSFRARMEVVFEGVPNIAPAELTQGVQDPHLSESAELFLCRLLALALNRKKPVEPGRWARALEDIKSQMPVLGYGETMPAVEFRSETAIEDLSPLQKLQFLQWLAFYALNSNDTVRDLVTAGHTRNPRKDPDLTGIPLRALGKTSMGTFWVVEANKQAGFSLYRTNIDSDHEPISESAKFKRMSAREKRLALKLDTPQKYILRWTVVASSTEELEAFMARYGELLSHRLQQKLTTLLEVYREADIRKLKEQRRDRRRKLLLDEAEAIRAGGGRYSGRTRGRRVNYNEEQVIDQGASPERRSNRRSRAAAAAEREEDDVYAYASDPEEASGTRKSKRLRGGPIEYTGVWDDRGQMSMLVTLRYRKKDPKQEEEEEKVAHGNMSEEWRTGTNLESDVTNGYEDDNKLPSVSHSSNGVPTSEQPQGPQLPHVSELHEASAHSIQAANQQVSDPIPAYQPSIQAAAGPVIDSQAVGHHTTQLAHGNTTNQAAVQSHGVAQLPSIQHTSSVPLQQLPSRSHQQLPLLSYQHQHQHQPAAPTTVDSTSPQQIRRKLSVQDLLSGGPQSAGSQRSEPPILPSISHSVSTMTGPHLGQPQQIQNQGNGQQVGQHQFTQSQVGQSGQSQVSLSQSQPADLLQNPQDSNDRPPGQ